MTEQKHECNTCKHIEEEVSKYKDVKSHCYKCAMEHIDGWEPRTGRLFADLSPDNGSDDKVITYDAKTPRKCLNGACVGISATQEDEP